MFIDWGLDIQGLGSIGTAVGVIALFMQVRVSKKQALTTFEDTMTKQYREIAQEIPLKALLGEDLEDSKYVDALPWFFQYVDLSNEQIFLRQKGRVSKETWAQWRDGIRSNLRRPVFAKAWTEIKMRAPTESRII
jgi:hypothetical protein